MFTVFGLNKWLMFDFHYNFIKKKSDFSKYPKDSKIFDETNKKFVGKMKDVSKGEK